MQIIEALAPFAWPDPPSLPGFSGKKAISGRMGCVVFVATEDYDGQIEISLTAFDSGKKRNMPSKPCTMAQAKWFFGKLGVDPIEHVRTPLIRHFVIRRGAVN